MRAAWTFAYNLIDRITPNGLSLYLLGAGLLAAVLAQAPMAFGFSDIDIMLTFALVLALSLAGLGNTALAAVATLNALRRSSALAARRPIGAFRFVHIAVAVYAALALPFLLPSLQAILNGGNEAMFMEILLFLTWTPLAGAALTLALLNGLRWDARFAVVGASASIAVFGCAVGYAPTIYGWDLQPLGWYAILASSIPVLGFLALFLRRAPVFAESRWRRRGTAAAGNGRLHHQHIVHQRHDWADAGQRRLQRIQGRGSHLHQDGGGSVRGGRHPRQLHTSRPDSDRHDPRRLGKRRARRRFRAHRQRPDGQIRQARRSRLRRAVPGVGRIIIRHRRGARDRRRGYGAVDEERSAGREKRE